MLRTTALTSLFLCITSHSFAAEKNPYAGESTRTIKSLSPDDMAGYVAGKGMGYAKTAELNSYPGPMHVLELADKLKLSPEQKTRTQKVFHAMKARSIAIGKKIVDKEAELDKLFAAGTIDEKKLAQSVQDISHLYGQYRLSHLQAHLEQKPILDSKQIALYSDLRGYGQRVNDHHSMKHPH